MTRLNFSSGDLRCSSSGKSSGRYLYILLIIYGFQCCLQLPPRIVIRGEFVAQSLMTPRITSLVVCAALQRTWSGFHDISCCAHEKGGLRPLPCLLDASLLPPSFLGSSPGGCGIHAWPTADSLSSSINQAMASSWFLKVLTFCCFMLGTRSIAMSCSTWDLMT